MPEKSIFIRLLEFGERKGIQGFRGDEYDTWKAEQPDVVNEYGDRSQEARTLLNACFDQQPTNPGFRYVLKTEYYFRLIEFKELEESRLASASANQHSKIAIGFSVFAILIGALQLNSNITLDANQVSKMAAKDYPASQRIESEQLTQVIEALKQSNINTAELARIIQQQNAKQIVGGEVKGK